MNRTFGGSVCLTAALLVALATWDAWAEPAHAQLVGYGGQVSASITGRRPVDFRFFDGQGNLVYQETVAADIAEGRMLVYVGSARGDMTDVLRKSRRMDVSLQGKQLESLPVIRTTRSELERTASDSSPMRAVWFTERDPGSEDATESLCRIVGSGVFTIPFTGTTVAVGTPGCGPGEFAVSAGYSFFTRPTQGVVVMGVISYFTTHWQVNYEVKRTPATLELATICCP